MTKKELLEMTGLSEQEFYQQYPTQESWTESYKKGGWIQKATASIKRRGTEGKCTPMSKPGCTGRALALAKTFHKMAAKRKKKEEGGYVDMYEEGGDTNPLLNIPESQRFPPVSESKLNSSVPLNFMGQPFATGAIEESISPLDFIGGVRGGVGLVKGLMKYRKAMKPNYIQIGDELFDMGPNPRAVRRATNQMHKGAQQLVLPNTFEDGGKIPDNVLRARLESHMSPGEAQDYIDSYAQGGVVDVYQLMGMPTPSMYAMGGPVMYKTGGKTSGPFEETDLGASSMQGMSIGQLKNALENNSEQTQRNVLKYDLNYINSLKNVLTPEEKFNLGLAYNRKLGNWNIGATGKVDYNRTIDPESKSSVIQRDVNLGVTGGYQGPGGTSLSGEVNYNPITKTWGGSAKGSIAFKEGGPVMYGMGGTTNIGDLSDVISAKNFPNMGYAMGSQVNYPQGLRKNMGNMPIFAEGGMTGPLTEINVEKGELLTNKDGRIVTKYRGGGMVPHPEEGMDERGTVPAQEGMFVITKAQAKNYEKAMKGSDRLYADAIRNNISYDKTKKEAAEEQAAMTAMDKFVAKYGGAVRRMYAKGGMVPMYDLGGGTGGLNMNNPGLGSYNLPSSFSQDMTYSMFPSVPQSLNLDSTRPTMTTNTSIFGALGKGTYNWDNLPDSGVGYTGADTPSGDMSNFDKYASYAPYAMQGLPIAWNLMQSMKKPTKVPGTLGAMSTALEAPKMSGEAGRRALAREGAAARYAWRQAGAQAGPAALTALTNTRMGRIADFEEGLRNAQGQMDYQAAAQRKAYEQFNAQQAMNRYMLQAQADDVPTRYGSAALGQLGQMGESMLNRQLLKQLEG